MTFGRNGFGKRTVYNLQNRTKYIFRKSHVNKLIKSLINFIYQNVTLIYASNSYHVKNCKWYVIMSNCNLHMHRCFKLQI